SAIDIVLSGSIRKVESIGLKKIFNRDVIIEFLETKNSISDLPKLEIELFFNDHKNKNLEGLNNSEGKILHGLRFSCIPDDQYKEPIKEILTRDEQNFPFEF